jgi:ssDNA-binding replication factor A large subunit
MSNENKDKDRHKETQAVRKVSHIKTIRSQRGEKERGGAGRRGVETGKIRVWKEDSTELDETVEFLVKSSLPMKGEIALLST